MPNIFHYQQFDILQDHAAMKVGTDSDLLGTLAAGGNRILDIGTGTGIIALMMAQRFPEAQLTAVEIDDNAVLDARVNFESSPFSERISLHHMSFQQFLQKMQEEGQEGPFDCVVCNPPYFDKSMEPENLGRMRARHTSSLPFSTLAQGAYAMLHDGGVFSVCIPPEVLSSFNAECHLAGFHLKETYQIKSLPHKAPKRYVVVHRKGQPDSTETQEAEPMVHTFCMRNADHSRSDWYMDLMKDFLVNPSPLKPI